MDGVPTASPDTEQTASPRIEWIEPQQSFAAFCRESTARIWKTQGGHVFSALAEGRRRLYNCVRIDNKPLIWKGTHGELTLAFVTLLGMIFAIFVVLFLLKFFNILSSSTVSALKYERFALTLPALLALGALAWRRLEVQLEYIQWGDTSFSLRGSPLRYAWQHFWTAFLVPLTLGWIIPWRTHSLHAIKTSGITHASRRFSYGPFDRGIYPKFAIAWGGIITVYVITMVTLGLTIGSAILAAAHEGHWAALLVPGTAVIGLTILGTGLLACLTIATWYRAYALAHHVSAIRIDTAQLKLQLPAGEFVRMALSNLAIKFASLGLWSVYANARFARFIITRLEVCHDGQSKAQLPDKSSTTELMTGYPATAFVSGR